MNDVVIATHADGVARFYYRTTDGAMNQTGQLVAPTVDPTLLASLAADLSGALGWNGVATPKPKAVKGAPKAIAKPKRVHRRANHAEMARRQQAILDYLAEHGNATIPEMAAALHPDAPFDIAASMVRKLVDRFVANGTLDRIRTDPGKADVYRQTLLAAP